ncbi:MBL fold metallo-hydrolase [Lacihabitans sp. CCS-44]|uniref:MBL fold metallo-hydrolase n=1 Tax=Lacihabitans sp. CCS-44 TaxID=2487331 RepID=UPI0020CE6F90|nr:rhodanese-like domain-containing protein [Lacihabitans sp. CCS-44]MCP9755971.1 MBL fold metallo-hydrolase [Lacihabitans sp. CCS-44]
MEAIKTINVNTLRNWLEIGQPVSILDIRPISERAEWHIPNSLHFNAYDKIKNNDFGAFSDLFLDRSVPVVAYCGGGKMSLVAAEMLQIQGYNTYSLEGGLKAWSLAWNTATINFPNFDLIQFRRTGKGCLSYMIISNNEAIVVDASLDINVYEQYLNANDAVLKYVIETHTHADHLSRSKEIAEKNSAALFLPANNNLRFEYQPIENETVFKLGNISVSAISTAGHTLESMSFNIDNKVLLTGDTLFINGVGRPDLKADTEGMKVKAKLLYQSLQKLLSLNDEIIVLPAHTSQPIDFDNLLIHSTLKKVKSIPLLQLNEIDFIETIIGRIPATPANYLVIVEKNLQGDFSDINPIDLEAGANRCAIS